MCGLDDDFSMYVNMDCYFFNNEATEIKNTRSLIV